MIVNELKNHLEKSWCLETCSPSLKNNWNSDNPSLGQCAITALILNDFCGGKIMRCMTPSGSHYYNLIDDEVIDLTVTQFNGFIPDYTSGVERTREYLLSNEDTKNRYIILMKNLKEQLSISNGKKYYLVDSNGLEYESVIPGMFGGNKKYMIYGKLDCPSAKYWIKKGYYVENRVFFEDEETAIRAGYRPCSRCMKKEYKEWKKNN